MNLREEFDGTLARILNGTQGPENVLYGKIMNYQNKEDFLGNLPKDILVFIESVDLSVSRREVWTVLFISSRYFAIDINIIDVHLFVNSINAELHEYPEHCNSILRGFMTGLQQYGKDENVCAIFAESQQQILHGASVQPVETYCENFSRAYIKVTGLQ